MGSLSGRRARDAFSLPLEVAVAVRSKPSEGRVFRFTFATI